MLEFVLRTLVFQLQQNDCRPNYFKEQRRLIYNTALNKTEQENKIFFFTSNNLRPKGFDHFIELSTKQKINIAERGQQ